MTSYQVLISWSSLLMPFCLLITKLFLILLYYVWKIYKSNSNFGAGCINLAIWADTRLEFVHSTAQTYKLSKKRCTYFVIRSEVQMLHWWAPREKYFLAHHLLKNEYVYHFLWHKNITSYCHSYIALQLWPIHIFLEHFLHPDF